MKQAFTLLILYVIILSCNETDNAIGEDWVDSKTKVYFIDTLTVKSSTIQFDSLTVSKANRFLIGAYSDPVFGYTESKSYVQLMNSVYKIEKDAVYDSIALILNYDTYFYNDTIPVQQFKVFEVLENIKPEDNSFYNTTHFKSSTIPLAIKNFHARPKADSLHISIDNIFGKTLFNKIKDNDINNKNEFLNQYKGLLIKSDNSNTTLLGFSKKSFLRLYYSVKNGEKSKEKNIDFTFNSSNSFTQTSSDKTGTFFESIINSQTILPSYKTDNNSFIQSSTGIVTRIDIPYIKSLNDISGDGVIIDARLKFTLKRNTYSDNLSIRDSLRFFIIDKKSNILGNLTLKDKKKTPIMSFIVNKDSEFETDLYVMDIRAFIDLKQTETYEKYYLVIYPQDFNSSVDRYIFNGEQTSDDLRMKLELTYAVYNE